MKRLILLTVTFLTLLSGSFAFAAPAFAAGSDVLDNACKDNAAAAKSAACDNSKATAITGKNGVLANVSRIVATIAGIAAIIIMIAGGLMFVTSNGDASKAGTARNTILYAGIGLVVIAMAQTIITLVVNRL